jgi:ribonuclease P protein component
MISARYKLNISLAPKDFKPFYKGKILLVKTRENGLKHSRIGVLVSRKNSTSAVGRNWLKRTVYGFFQDNRRFLDEKNPPTDFLAMFLTSYSEIKDNKEILIQELNNVISI